jgi:hypothetical protein
MLSKMEDLRPVFTNLSTDLSKEVDCIRVDGAADEGPSHETIQYWWTFWHVTQHKVATLVTTRCSGSSYLNRVELQNGCLSLGHAGTFIPSTLAGPCTDPDSGNISASRLQKNLELAITAYISRVNGCPCGDGKINLYRGSNSESFQNISDSLEIFLKGSKKKREDLRHNVPKLYEEFKKIWDIRNDHMVSGLPESYVFFLKCCYKPDCKHPVCVSQIRKELTWFPGGPSISKLPFPSPDPVRPWGSTTCNSCKEFCPGHYHNTFIDTSSEDSLKKIVMPPSVVLKRDFATNKITEKTAEKVLLSNEDTHIWLEHLTTIMNNRKRGAAKAAATRRKRAAAIRVNPPHSTSDPTGPSVPSTSHSLAQAPGPSTCHSLAQGPGPSTSHSLAQAPSTGPSTSHSLAQASSTSPSTSLPSSVSVDLCQQCNTEYSASSAPFWIVCDGCNNWYCSLCESLEREPTSELYICRICCKK